MAVDIPYIRFSHWSDEAKENSRDAVAYQFGPNYETPIDLSHADIKVAVYAEEDWSGSAFVLYRDERDGLYYEVNGSHCSCYGLEDQWKPERISTKELLNRTYVIGGSWEQMVKEAIASALVGVEQESD